jgi:hypothetical protein
MLEFDHFNWATSWAISEKGLHLIILIGQPLGRFYSKRI